MVDTPDMVDTSDVIMARGLLTLILILKPTLSDKLPTVFPSTMLMLPAIPTMLVLSPV